jgi:hypothetical protein
MDLVPVKVQAVLEWCNRNHETLQQRNVVVRAQSPEGDVGRWLSVKKLMRRPEAAAEQEAAGLEFYVPCVSVRAEDGGYSTVIADVPQNSEFREALVRRTHQSNGHFGDRKTLATLGLSGWWVANHSELLAKVLRECGTCAATKGLAHPPKVWQAGDVLDHHLRPTEFNGVVHVDLVGPLNAAPGKQCWLVCFSDEHTRWVELAWTEDSSAPAVARIFQDLWIQRFGAPQHLASDRGKNLLAGKVLVELAKSWVIGRIRTTAWHPQSNAIEERWHRTLKDLLCRLINQHEVPASEWASMLSTAAFLIRSTVHSELKQTPAKLVLGYDYPVPDYLVRAPEVARMCKDGVVRFVIRAAEDTVAASETAKELQLRQVGVLRRAEKHLRKLHTEAEGNAILVSDERLNPESRIPQYEVGQHVRIWLGKQLKTDPLVLNARLAPHRWSEPWRVVAVSADRKTLDVVLARDPLQYERVSWMQVKRTFLEQEVRDALEGVFQRTMEQKKLSQRDAELARAPAKWAPEKRAANEEQFSIERVLQTRVQNRRREVLVLWEGGEKTWEPFGVIKKDAPELWEEFQAQGGRASKAASARSKK